MPKKYVNLSEMLSALNESYYEPASRCGRCKHFYNRGRNRVGICKKYGCFIYAYDDAEELGCESWEQFKFDLPKIGLHCDNPVKVEKW